jgi:hypothetical protein
MGKVKRLELWWQLYLYVTSVSGLRKKPAITLCAFECTFTVRYGFWGFNRVLVLFVDRCLKNMLSSLYEAQTVTHIWARDTCSLIKQYINQLSTAYTVLGYQLAWSLIHPFHILHVLSIFWCPGALYRRMYCGIISTIIPSKLFINYLCLFHFLCHVYDYSHSWPQEGRNPQPGLLSCTNPGSIWQWNLFER